jgi:hypothetical protein
MSQHQVGSLATSASGRSQPVAACPAVVAPARADVGHKRTVNAGVKQRRNRPP